MCIHTIFLSKNNYKNIFNLFLSFIQSTLVTRTTVLLDQRPALVGPGESYYNYLPSISGPDGKQNRHWSVPWGLGNECRLYYN